MANSNTSPQNPTNKHMSSISFILKPLKLIKIQKKIFFLWFSFTLLAGLLGPAINFIVNLCFEKNDFWMPLLRDSIQGTFYTYSIVVIASSIGMLFIKLLSQDVTDTFKNIKLLFIAICIFPMFFGGILYSSHVQTYSLEYQNITSFKIDWPQLIMFALAIVIAIYSFCLEYITLYPEQFPEHTDDYLADTNLSKEELKNKEEKIPEDPKMPKL